jgi:phosphoribosyl-AMP cyclohydrolase
MTDQSRDREESTSFLPQFDKRGGLLPVIVQDADSREVLMLGYANSLALERTRQTGLATFWSTSRNQLWTKGETSGDTLKIQEIRVDCDQDALLYLVSLEGSGVCHTKGPDNQARYSCFFRTLDTQRVNTLTFLPGTFREETEKNQ